jgi:hypothetical protein
VIDFRVPKEHKLRAEEIAAAQGRFVDEVCREIFSAGLQALDARVVRVVSLVGGE